MLNEFALFLFLFLAYFITEEKKKKPNGRSCGSIQIGGMRNSRGRKHATVDCAARCV